jgi:hypothetical protein
MSEVRLQGSREPVEGLITCSASGLDTPENYATKGEKKLAYVTRFAPGMYYIHSHSRVDSLLIFGFSTRDAPFHHRPHQSVRPGS